MKQDRRLTIDAELRAQTPQSETPEDGPAENSADPVSYTHLTLPTTERV